jgi:hypothetical protein
VHRKIFSAARVGGGGMGHVNSARLHGKFTVDSGARNSLQIWHVENERHAHP